MEQMSWMEQRPAKCPEPHIQCRSRCIQICFKSDKETSSSWTGSYGRSRAERVKPREDLTKFKRILKMSIKITLTSSCSSTRSSKANSCRTQFSEWALQMLQWTMSSQSSSYLETQIIIKQRMAFECSLFLVARLMTHQDRSQRREQAGDECFFITQHFI